MRFRNQAPGLLMFTLVAALGTSAAIIDRIVVVVDSSIIKTSDIDRDIRATALINQEPLDLSIAGQKRAVNRLIDQIFIRREIDIGGYPAASPEEADRELARLKHDRYRTSAAFQQALQKYGISAVDLHTQFQWQLTVLRFIDVRFRPGANVTDDEIAAYFNTHAAALRRANRGKITLDDFRQQIQDTLAAEKVDQQFFTWLDDQRKVSKIRYREADLK